MFKILLNSEGRRKLWPSLRKTLRDLISKYTRGASHRVFLFRAPLIVSGMKSKVDSYLLKLQNSSG